MIMKNLPSFILREPCWKRRPTGLFAMSGLPRDMGASSMRLGAMAASWKPRKSNFRAGSPFALLRIIRPYQAQKSSCARAKKSDSVTACSPAIASISSNGSWLVSLAAASSARLISGDFNLGRNADPAQRSFQPASFAIDCAAWSGFQTGNRDRQKPDRHWE